MYPPGTRVLSFADQKTYKYTMKKSVKRPQTSLPALLDRARSLIRSDRACLVWPARALLHRRVRDRWRKRLRFWLAESHGDALAVGARSKWARILMAILGLAYAFWRGMRPVEAWCFTGIVIELDMILNRSEPHLR